MALTFPYPVKADISDEMSLPSIILSYGDGYKQRSPDGLNLPKIVWNIQCPIANKTAQLNLQSFLISVGNSVPFLWQSPRDITPQLYYITGKIGGSYRLGGGSKPDFYIRTMQFEYANIKTIPIPIIDSFIYLRLDNNKTYPIPTIYLQPSVTDTVQTLSISLSSNNSPEG